MNNPYDVDEIRAMMAIEKPTIGKIILRWTLLPIVFPFWLLVVSLTGMTAFVFWAFSDDDSFIDQWAWDFITKPVRALGLGRQV